MTGLSTRCRCLVCGMMGRKMSSARVCIHQRMRAAGAGIGDKERGQVGDHQEEDEQRDEAGFPGELFAEPARADEEAADEEAENADGAGDGEGGGEVEIEAADEACGVEKAEPEARRHND